jgi:hypothetical protein
MLTGYNTDFKYQGKVYHVQTEDGGVNSPFITSLLYHQGAILSSRKTSYEDILKADCLDEVVREIMMEQHKQMIRDLMQGKLQSGQAAAQPAPQAAAPKPAAAPQPAAAAKPAPAAKEPPPVQVIKTPAPPKAEPTEKSLDEIILDFLAQEQKVRAEKK